MQLGASYSYRFFVPRFFAQNVPNRKGNRRPFLRRHGRAQSLRHCAGGNGRKTFGDSSVKHKAGRYGSGLSVLNLVRKASFRMTAKNIFYTFVKYYYSTARRLSCPAAVYYLNLFFTNLFDALRFLLQSMFNMQMTIFYTEHCCVYNQYI